MVLGKRFSTGTVHLGGLIYFQIISFYFWQEKSLEFIKHELSFSLIARASASCRYHACQINRESCRPPNRRARAGCGGCFMDASLAHLTRAAKLSLPFSPAANSHRKTFEATDRLAQLKAFRRCSLVPFAEGGGVGQIRIVAPGVSADHSDKFGFGNVEVMPLVDGPGELVSCRRVASGSSSKFAILSACSEPSLM
jgi:hypothetical protein